MYNAQSTIERVQSLIKQKGDTQKRILEICGLDENTLKKMTDKRGIASFSLAKIADELNCSVDYLLGRSENPQSHQCPVTLGNISNNRGVIGGIANSAPVTITNGDIPPDPQVIEMCRLFNSLSQINRAKLLVYADELNNN